MAANRGPQLACVTWLFLALAWVAICLRAYVKIFMTKSLGLDDWFAVASICLFTPLCVFTLEGIKYGTGRHLADLPPENIPLAFKYWYLSEIFYSVSSAAFKYSVSVFLMRICINKMQIKLIWGVITLITLSTIFFTFVLIFQCSPSSYFWMRFAGANGKCMSTTVIANSIYAQSAVGVVSDSTLAILPIFLVWNLKMNQRTKISVAFILALGAVASAATIIRIPYVKVLVNTTDFLIDTVDVAIWSIVEPGLGITGAALACCRPLFQSFLSRSFWGSSRSRSDSAGWPSQGLSNAGYMRSDGVALDERGKGSRAEGFNMNRKNQGTVTTITRSKNNSQDDDDIEFGHASVPRDEHERSGSMHSLKNGTDWAESKLTDDSSEDYPNSLSNTGDERLSEAQKHKLKIGVRTTTEITNVPGKVTSGNSSARVLAGPATSQFYS